MKTLQSRCFFLLTSLFLIIGIAFTPAMASEVSRTISVVGTAASTIVPDTVIWTVEMSTLDKSLEKSKSKSDTKMRQILKAVKVLGVASEDVQTGYLHVEKKYDRDKYGNHSVFKGYGLRRQLSIKERDISQFDAFLTALLANGDVQVSYRLDSSTLHKTRAKTRLQSVKAAKDKAAEMAKAAGVKIGAPISIEEDSFNPSGRNHYRNINALSFNGISKGESATFSPGTLEVKVSVKAVFELR